MKITGLVLALALACVAAPADAQIWGGGGGGGGGGSSSSGAAVGTVWSLGTSAADVQWNAACGNDDILVALAQSGTGNRAAYSTDDGLTWALGTISDHNWNNCIWTGTQFVAVATARTATSANGITWTDIAAVNAQNWTGIAVNPSGLIVSTAFDGTTQQVMTSTNGTAWTLRSNPQAGVWLDVAWINDRFTSTSYSGATRCMHSTDGTTWTLGTCPASAWVDVECSATRCVTVGDSGTIAWSNDGITYTAATGQAAINYRSVDFCDPYYVVVAVTGTANRVATSLDGKAWTPRASAADRVWRAMACASDVAFAVSNDGTGSRVMTSR